MDDKHVEIKASTRKLCIAIAVIAAVLLCVILIIVFTNKDDNTENNNAEPFTEGLEYAEIKNADDAVVGYSVKSVGSATNSQIIIPKAYNKKPVTSIDENAFKDCDSLTGITIPKTITSIGKDAFSGCNKLIQTENGIQYVEKWVIGCDNSAVSPDLRSDTVGIGYAAFRECKSLTSVTLPDGIENIGVFAFWDCDKLTSVNIPSSLKRIENGVFHGCNGLTSMTIPSNITSIGEGAFQNCSNLTSITIPNSVTNIEKYAFWHCSSLTDIAVPNSITKIGYGTYYGCSSLTSITIPNNITSIEQMAFMDCSSLTSINIPNSVTKIGNMVIDNTPYYEDNANWQNGVLYINNHLIEAQKTISGEYTVNANTLTIADCAFDDCKNLTSVKLPNSVIRIGYLSFDGCSSLASVEIPSSVTNIDNYAFADCGSLTAIKFNGTKAAWNKIEKGKYWNRGTADYVITCTDGTLTKEAVNK